MQTRRAPIPALALLHAGTIAPNKLLLVIRVT